MLRVLFAEHSTDRPVKEFFEYPLRVGDVPHSFHTLDRQFPELKAGDVVLAMGGKTLDWYKEQSLIPKNKGLGKYRNQVHDIDYGAITIPTFFSFDPTLTKLDPAREPDVQWDINLALRYLKTGTIDPILGEYNYVPDFSEEVIAIAAAEEVGSKVLVCLDLETIGLDEFAPEARIVTVQVTIEEGKTSVYPVPKTGIVPDYLRGQIEILCTSTSVKMTGANLKFDARWIKQHFGFWITNQTFDTSIVGSCLNENRGNSLNLHAKLFTELGGYDDEFERKHDKSRMDLALESDPAGFLTYSGGDTDACYRVTKRLRHDLMQDRALTNFYVKLLQPAADAFAVMEHRGVVVDMDRYKELQSEVEAHIKDVEGQMLGMMSGSLRMKYRENLTLSRAVILRDHMFDPVYGMGLEPQMFTEKTEAISTAVEHFEMFDKNPEAAEFIGLLKEYRSATKTLSTYIIGFMKHLRSDGRFHPAYRMFRGDYGGSGGDEGTVTGRTSATDPAYQTIPKHTKWANPLRSVYVPPPGFAILKVDYSQGELRVTACVANETTMIETYKQGIDLHLRTGCMVNDIPLEQALKMKARGDKAVKVIRQGGKAGNFGLIYGMGAEGFMHYASTAYGVDLKFSEAENFRNNFFAEYDRLPTWHDDSIATARRMGYIRSPLGRIRHLPLITSRNGGVRSKQERQSINSPIQCTLSDLALYAAAILKERYPELWLFGMTHDELAFYVPEDHVEEWAIKVKEVMENLPLKENFGWEPQLPFLADAEYSLTNMAECTEMDWLEAA